jgi:4-hydroxybenzoate polyprenyltransferase
MTTVAMTSTPQSPQTPVAKLRTAAADIKLAHSIFALPFAVLASFLARLGTTPWPRFAGQLALVVACMVAARTWAMMVNRLADRDFDKDNPRTTRRAVASGRLSVRDARLITAGAAVAFIALCSVFWFLHANLYPLALSVPVLAWIALYSYTKRFTWLCHIFLGGALAASPLAAAIAVDPASLSRTPALWFLAGMVVLWVAGFDVIYALQDLAFDRARGLFSIPSRLGPHLAIWISRALHAGALAMLILAWRAEPRLASGWLFAAAVAMVGLLLITEHTILARRGEAGLDMAFFTVNGVVSCVVGAAGVAAVLL